MKTILKKPRKKKTDKDILKQTLAKDAKKLFAEKQKRRMRRESKLRMEDSCEE